MKNIYKYLIAVLPFFVSCSTEEDEVVLPPEYDAKWFEQATVDFIPLGEENGFVYNINESTGQSFWGTTEADFQVSLDLGSDSDANIEKIQFFAFVETRSGANTQYYGGAMGKPVATVNNPGDTFEITISSDEVYQLYSTELASSRPDGLATDDLVELKWAITDANGDVLDTREGCVGFNCTYGIQTKVNYVDTWLGEFEYTWIEVGPDTETYSHGDLTVGSKGSVLFSPGDEEGQYSVDDLSMGASFSVNSGYITFDDATGVLSVYNNTTYANKWTLVSVTPEVLTLEWEYYYTQWYAEYGTVELRRDDGLSWPEITTIENY
ncbi:hypothetical protein [Robertkochia flava]|uniref:hypothetical protein n=1 Tax=Robertkochia flava TaxID=3447986 RepID=UPI001CCA0725|nr:hypothetical protein [Robertkochia marina]